MLPCFDNSLVVSNLTCPDIAFVVIQLSQFIHQPSQLHWQALKRLLRYLKCTFYHGLFLCRSSTLTLQAYSDADWAGNRDDRSSTTGYLIYLGSNLIAWISRKQRFVARSSTEAEYHAIAYTAAELAWIQSLLRELGVSLPTSPTISYDNVGVTF
ncbi:hypothetical protein L3X38_003267 [Prunus dulcis]|uniref:Transposable element protein n=1 Tax=Prunus dulcis TaxID=3755 RepID=A0AAD4ZLQ8_PRUDU|nr:hypothetical protein L3X38_003267 [Prunus dulcis]